MILEDLFERQPAEDKFIRFQVMLEKKNCKEIWNLLEQSRSPDACVDVIPSLQVILVRDTKIGY